MSRRLLTCLLAAMLVLGACGGGDGEIASSTTLAEGETSTTQTSVPSTEGTTAQDDDGQTVGIGDIPQECIDAFVDYLHEIEPLVEDVDWTTASMADFEQISESLASVSEEYATVTADSNCDDLEIDATAEESFQYMIDLANEEAPGTVPYFEMIRDFAGSFSGDSDTEVSNDCETDIATLQAIIDEGVPMQEVAASELGAIGGLVTSISTNCSQERSIEFFSQEDVTEFMGG